MVKRRKALKGAKGSALFMVICIMAILMVVAVTAMAMVSLAYTRSLQNYTASQSYVTAVNTLDMITATSHYTGSGSIAPDYGQDTAAIEKIAQPLREVLWDCMAATTKGGQKKYGSISITDGPLGSDSIQFLTFDGTDNTKNNILYEVLPAPANATDGMASVDPADIAAPDCGYGESVLYNGRYYTHAKVRITVKVQSGTGDTAQIRTVSKVVDPMISWEETSSPSPSPSTPGTGLFDQAVKALGKYTSAAGVTVVGGISTKETGEVKVPGLNEITKSMYINGGLNTQDSGWSGNIKIGADKQITVNGTLKVPNDFNIESTFVTGTSSGSKPFIYCNELQWESNYIPAGEIDIITKTGGSIKADGKEITGNIISGGDFNIDGNNAKITGKIFVDGDINIEKSLSNGGGIIYYTGNITGNTGNTGGVKFEKIDPKKFNFDSPGANEDGQMIISSPDGSRQYNVMTEESVFSSCYDDDGNLIQSDSDTSLTSDPATGTFTVTDEDGKAIPAEDIVVVDATTRGTITVEPGKTIVFDTSKGGNFSDFEIEVAKGAGIVNIVQTSGDIDLKGVRIWSETVKEAIESGKELDMDAIASDPEYSKIFWDVPSGSNITMNDMDPGNLLNAYIYGPEANFKAATQNAGVAVNYKGMKNKDGGTNRAWLLGSVIGNDISMGNGLGIIFIDPYANGDNPGGDPGDDPPPSTPTTKKNVQQNINNGNFYFTNR